MTMKIEVTRVTSWTDVLNAARFTQRKSLKSGEPSVKWKKKIIKAEHSPLRCLMFNIDFYDIPYYVSVHLVRHVHSQPFVSSSRPDVNKENSPRSEQRKTDPVNMRLFLNAQEIIKINAKGCLKGLRGKKDMKTFFGVNDKEIINDVILYIDNEKFKGKQIFLIYYDNKRTHYYLTNLIKESKLIHMIKIEIVKEI